MNEVLFNDFKDEYIKLEQELSNLKKNMKEEIKAGMDSGIDKKSCNLQVTIRFLQAYREADYNRSC